MGTAAILVMWPGPFEDAFNHLFQEGSTRNLVSICLVVIEEKKFKNNESARFGPRSMNGSAQVPDAAYQHSRALTIWFHRRRFFKVFTVYEHGGHIGHVTWTIWINFPSPIPWRRHMKFGVNQPSNFQEKEVWKCWISDWPWTKIHVTRTIWTNFRSPIP